MYIKYICVYVCACMYACVRVKQTDHFRYIELLSLCVVNSVKDRKGKEEKDREHCLPGLASEVFIDH